MLYVLVPFFQQRNVELLLLKHVYYCSVNMCFTIKLSPAAQDVSEALYYVHIILQVLLTLTDTMLDCKH
jgi:hypothetical protein